MKWDSVIRPSFGLMGAYFLMMAAVWMTAGVGAFYSVGMTWDEWWQLVGEACDWGWVWLNVAGFFLSAVSAVFMARLLDRYAFTHSRSFLPVVVFMLFMAVWEPSHMAWQSHAALVLFIGALYAFLGMYRRPTAAEEAFLGSLLVSVGSMLVNGLLLLVPLCWVGFGILRCLSLRTFLASILGVAAPWVLHIAGVYVLEGTVDVAGLWQWQFEPGFGLEELMVPTKIYIALLFFVFFVVIAGTYAGYQQQAVNTRRNVNFVLLFLLGFIAAFLFQADFSGVFFPFIALCFAVFIAHVYSYRPTRLYRVVFAVFVSLNLLFAVYNFVW